MSTGTFRVSRELYPEKQEKLTELEINLLENRIVDRTYVSRNGLSQIEVRHSEGRIQVWHSPDNGDTWRLQEEFPARENLGDGRFRVLSIGPFYLDQDNGLLLRFLSEWTLPPNDTRVFMDTGHPDAYARRLFTQISRDAGETWETRKPFIQAGSAYDLKHWAEDIYYGKSQLVPEAPPFFKLPDGTIVLPFQRHGDLPEKETYGSIQAVTFHGRWKEDLSGLDWEMAGKVYGGGCEQTAAVLDDGRIFVILRAQGLIDAYPFSSNLRPCTVSGDAGRTWSGPRPLAYTDGSLFSSPWAWSRLIKSAKNGRWYWIANILPDSKGVRRTCDPRYPLQIAELDTETLAIRKETVTVIEDRSPKDPELVRFSNFVLYEDRQNRDFVLLMMKSYSELTPDWYKLPRPNYLYRISLSE